MKKKAALVLASGAAVIAVASAIHAVPDKARGASRTEQVSHEQGQIQAPPPPPRPRPLERVIVAR
jgi:hypothetical protein